MNKAHPIPILPDDFILMDPGQHPQAGQIVVADLKHPPTPDEQAGVVKRYSRQGLKSESSEDHKPIPLRDAKLRGVVIAVAKRFTEDE